MITENSLLKGSNNQLYRIGRELGSGGEGRVFTIQGQLLAVKIYKKQSLPQEEKLRYMVSHPIPDLTGKDGLPVLHIAWPLDIVYDNLGNFVGYVMPLIEGGVEIFEIHRCCTSPKAKNLFPNYSWKLNVTVAKNLAMSVDYLHRHKCVIGDMNCKNILVDENGAIIFLDVDSFDIRNEKTGAHYKCSAGTEDYLPPELQQRDLRLESANFDYLTDDFALAIHIFQLLMDNYHPFSCRQTLTTKDSTSYNRRLDQIGDGQCPYINNYPNVDIPLGAPRIREILPEYIDIDFRNTFNYVASNAILRRKLRTPAAKWATDLAQLCEKCDNGGLAQCRNNPKHEFLYSIGFCGHCVAQARLSQHVEHAQENKNPVVSSSGKHSTTYTNYNQAKTDGEKKNSEYTNRARSSFTRMIAILAIVLITAGLLFPLFRSLDNSKDDTDETNGPGAKIVLSYDELTEPVIVPTEAKEILPEVTTIPTETKDERVYLDYMDGTYHGYAENGVPHGQGIWISFFGEYEGSFSNGYPNGYGTFTYYGDIDRSISGNWSYGTASRSYSAGAWQGKSCGTYSGMILDGTAAGFGVLDFDYAGKFEGAFYNGWPDGRGIYTYSNGNEEDGLWTWGSGYGSVYESRAGSNYSYEGMICDGVVAGFGAIIPEKCGTFYGEQVNGAVNGRGVYVYKSPMPTNQPTIEGDTWKMVSGSRKHDHEYYGLTLNGQWQGYGLGITSSGNHYVGEIRNEFRQGYGRLFVGGSLYQEGTFNEGYLIKTQ